MMERRHWQDLQLLDVDGATPLNVDEATRRRLLDEFRRTGGSMHGAFFARIGAPHEDPEDASTWGPTSPEHVDWTGLDANTNIRYQAWLGELLMGEGATEEEAVEAAVAEYETSVGYGDAPHLYPDRETLVANLDVIGVTMR